MDARLTELVAALRAAGAVVVDPLDLPVMKKLSEPEDAVLHYEFKDGINAWFTSLGPDAPVKSLAELIAFNEAHRAQEMPFFAQEELIAAQARGPLTEPAYLDALALSRKLARAEGIDAAMDANRLDALVALSSGPAWLIDSVNGDHFTGDSTSLAAVAGYPSVTVPVGQVFGLPVGLSFFGRAWSDARLLALAADFEAHAQSRREPKFLPHVEVR
jgi:amidase